MNFDNLKKLISDLRDNLSKYRIEEVFGCAFLEMTRIDWANPDKMNLHSPFRQCGYIASLALSVEQNDKTLPLDEDAWKEVCQKANKIYDYYALMHFPKDGDFSKITEERHDQGGVAMPSFLLGLCTGIAASVEQVKDDIISLYAPFSEEIEAEIGISVSEIVNICTFIEGKLQNRIEDGPIQIGQCWQAFRKELDGGEDFEIAVANARKCMSEDVVLNFIKMGTVSLTELKNKFSLEKITVFMSLLSQKRVEHSDSEETIFPTEELSISLKPLAQINDDDFALITGNHLVSAAQENLYRCVEHLGLLERYNKHKGTFLEEKSLYHLQGLFGTNAQYYHEVCETPDDQNEHDILIVYKKCLLIIECKAKRIRKNFRDIEKSFVRIKDDFKSYIQEGYNQARNLEKLILSQEETTLYKKGGDIATVIKRNSFDRIEKIIITYENEGILATKLNLLINLDEGDDFPFSMNIHDLRQLSSYKKNIKLTPEKFIEYLGQRKLVHGKLVNDDELDVFGFFLNKGSLNEVIQEDCDLYYIPPGFSKIFDEAYSKKKSNTLVVKKKKIGRNDPCPCGSNKKYKKCCLNR